MKRLVGTKQTLRDQRDALDRLEGMPKAPEFVGDAIRHLIPATFVPGAPGWTEHVCEVEDELDAQDRPTGRGQLNVLSSVATRNQGKSVDLGGGKVVVVDLRAATDLGDDPPGRDGPARAPQGGAGGGVKK